MKKAIFFILLLGSGQLMAQSSFYTFKASTSLAWNDTLIMPSMTFKVPVSEFDQFEEFWIDHLNDVADGSVDDDDHYIVAEEIEVPSIKDVEFTAYSRLVDLHDSIEIRVAFEDTSGFLSRSNYERMAVLEASAKRFVTNAFVEFKNEILEEREDKLDEARDEVDEIQDEIGDLNRSIQNKTQHIQERRTEIAEARQVLTVVAEQIGQQRQTLARLPLNAEEEREDAEDEIKKLERRQEKMQEDIRDWDEDIFDTEDAIRELRVEVGETEIRLEHAKTNLSNARTRHEELRLEIAQYRVN